MLKSIKNQGRRKKLYYKKCFLFANNETEQVSLLKEKKRGINIEQN